MHPRAGSNRNLSTQARFKNLEVKSEAGLGTNIHSPFNVCMLVPTLTFDPVGVNSQTGVKTELAETKLAGTKLAGTKLAQTKVAHTQKWPIPKTVKEKTGQMEGIYNSAHTTYSLYKYV